MIKALLIQFFLMLSIFSQCSFAQGGNNVSFSQMVVFGDSYSDNGNTYRVSDNTYPGSAYYLGHFTDGYTWSEYLAMKLGLDPMDTKIFRDYAYGQAQINGKITLQTYREHAQKQKWYFTIPDLAGEIKQYLDDKHIKPKQTLYIIFMGTNDFLNHIPSTRKNDIKFVNGLLNSIASAVKHLESLGAEHIVIFTIRDLNASPLAAQLSQKYQHGYLQSLSAMTKRFNRRLNHTYNKSTKVTIYNAYSFDKKIFSKRQRYTWYRNKYILSIYRKPCYVNNGNYIERISQVCVNPWRHFYYDRIHPTTYVHKLMADDVYTVLSRKQQR